MRLNMLWMTAVLSVLGCSGPSLTSETLEGQRCDSRGFIDWVTDQAIEIDDLIPSNGSGYGTGVRNAVGQARVVGLGESRHDTREQLLLKSGMVRFLVEEMGFRALILEESVPHTLALDDYVLTGEGDLRGVMNRLAGWYLWDTEEMYELVAWIRGFNEGRGPDDQVRIFGMDITAPALGVEAVLDFLRATGVDLETNDGSLGLELQDGDFWPTTWQRYSTLSDGRKAALTAEYNALIDVVDEHRHLLTARSSEREYERYRWFAEVGRLGHQMFSTSDRAQGGAIREHGMVQSLLWILENEMADQKAVLWAHNLHVAKSVFRMPGLVEGDLEPMGVELARELGDSYVAIGGSFGSGSYPHDLPPGERSFEVMAESTMDGALAGVNIPIYMVDLRKAAKDTAATMWLQEEREWRAQDLNSVLVPGEAFDLVYFMSEISRSAPMPSALERFQELQRQQ